MIPKNNDMRFEVTTKCNYNCVICPREKLTRKKETMSFELFKNLFDKIIAETDQYDTLTFPGMGEPLLDDSLDDKIRYIKKVKPSMDILLLTNGSLLSLDRFLGLQRFGLTSVRVSLYGTNPKNYNRVHGITNKGMFEKVKNNLLQIVKIKKKTKLYLTYNIVEGDNCSHLQEWIDFWKDRVDLLEVWKPHNWVTGRKYRKIQNEKLKTCNRPFSGPLQVQVDGTVNMCCFDFDGKLTIGDLKCQSLKDIFKSSAYEKIRQCHQTGDFSGSGLICEDCDQRNAKKDDVMAYNSKFDIKERVNMISTTYKKIT
jgi:wyosine [tRNA(Phe)-imidazoG37] synthetase (radical SAM superfamily)